VEVAGIGVAGDHARPFGDDIRIIFGQQRLLSARHFSLVRRLDLEGRRAVFDGVRVDAGDGRDIAVAGRADDGVAHRSTAAQKKTPRTKGPGRWRVSLPVA
jgi:hypothetical protein